MKKFTLLNKEIIPIKNNLELIADFRDKTIHFYNDSKISVLIYSLSQTAIVNYRDFLKVGFKKDISKQITISLLPLALHAPVDPIKLSNIQKDSKNKYVDDFCEGLKVLIRKLEEDEYDTGRFMTIFNVKLESVKKVTSADFTAGLDNTSEAKIIHKKVDPNQSFPLSQGGIVTSKKYPERNGKSITYGKIKLSSYVFQAIIHSHKIREDNQYCWVDKKTRTSRYSHEFMNFLKKLSIEQVEKAMNEYRHHKNRKCT